MLNIKLNSGVIEIGSKALDSCNVLHDMYVPKSVEKIGESVFGPVFSQALMKSG